MRQEKTAHSGAVPIFRAGFDQPIYEGRDVLSMRACSQEIRDFLGYGDIQVDAPQAGAARLAFGLLFHGPFCTA